MNELRGEFLTFSVTPWTISSCLNLGFPFFLSSSGVGTSSVGTHEWSFGSLSTTWGWGSGRPSLLDWITSSWDLSTDAPPDTGVEVLIAANGDSAADLWLLCKKFAFSKESFDFTDLKLSALGSTISWLTVFWITFPVLADDERSSVHFLDYVLAFWQFSGDLKDLVFL